MSSSSLPLRWVLGPWLATVVALGLFFAWSEARQAERFEREMERLRSQVAEANAGRAVPQGAVTPGPAACPPQAGIDAATVELIAQRVATVLEARGQAGSAKGGERPETAPEPPRTAEQRAAIDRAERVLDDAISRGRLRREDVMEMRRQLAQAGHAQQEASELVRRIAMAINTNKLVPEDPNFVMP